MALRVWLPLNGNLNNQGLSNVNIANTGATINNNGKIGNCYSFGTSTSYLEIPSETMNTFSECTLSFWINIISWNTAYCTIFQAGAIGYAWKDYVFGVLRNNANSTLCFTFGNGSTSSQANYLTPILNIGTWYHLTFSYKSGQYAIYVNGEETSSGTTTYTVDFTKITRILVGCSNNKSSYQSNCLINDLRIYDEVLSPKQIKEISKGLVAHYPLNNRFNTNNLIINGFGELGGNIGWANSNVSTTEIPSGVSDVKASFYNGNSTINNNLYRVPICPTHSYTISAYIKSSGATSGNTYPSIFPYDIDKKFIDFFKCKSGFDSNTVTTLAQPLNPGDTKIYATDLSQWSTASNNYYYHVAIFGYTDSTGFLYPDLEYTQDSPAFGTYADKSHIDKTNNIITLNAAYNGKARPAGTTICQATEGSTYYYPFGGLALSSLTDWTFKTATIVPVNEHRLRYSRYWTYSTYNNTYHAAIKLIDNTWMNTEITDCSGNGYNSIINGTLTYNNDSPRYEGCTKFNANTSYIKLPALTTGGFASSFTIIYWANIADMNGKMAWGFSDGNRLNIYPTGSVICCNTGDGANNPYQNNGSSIAYSQWNNGWHQFAMVADGSTNKLYVDGQYQGTAKTYKGITGTQIYLSGWASGNSYRWTDGSISDFRIYATALSADDILTMYKNSGIIDNKGNAYTYEFQENRDNMMWYINNAIIDKTYKDGLNSYTQTNCQVTLTDDGYRIYRPPNIVHNSSTMHNMWGGLKINIRDANYKDHLKGTLQTGHKYIILYDVKGQTSKAQTSIGWTNQMGWGGGGLNPIPTNVQYKAIPANFNNNNWETFFYKWDLTDDVYKVCTSSYSSFVAGNIYLSYADFMVGWGYENTGSLGTDIYIKNIRMYDITDENNPKLIKTGAFTIDGIHENNETKLRQNEIEANSFIEI